MLDMVCEMLVVFAGPKVGPCKICANDVGMLGHDL